MIDLFPPATGAGKKFDLYTFRNGRTARAEGGIIKCVDHAEANELIAEGWMVRQAHKIEAADLQKIMRTEALHSGVVPITAAKIGDDAMLRRAAAASFRHHTGYRQRVIIGELDLGDIGRVHAEIEAGDITLDGATTISILDDINDPDLGAALLRASGAFLDAMQDAEEQTIARTTIAALIQAVLQQQPSIADAVTSQKLRQRSV